MSLTKKNFMSSAGNLKCLDVTDTVVAVETVIEVDVVPVVIVIHTYYADDRVMVIDRWSLSRNSLLGDYTRDISWKDELVDGVERARGRCSEEMR